MTLDEHLTALRDAVSLAEGHGDLEVVEGAKRFLQEAEERRAYTMDSTTIVCAGATGSGKSSIVNALVGREVAHVAAIRPTTDVALAVGTAVTEPLMNLLDIRQRVTVPAVGFFAPTQASSAVLIDLPDIDSFAQRHHDESARLIRRADVMVWVVDPQKYADAVIHEDYLRELGLHADVMLVVLNHIDKLDARERGEVTKHLRALLDADGSDAPIYTASALTGEGIDELRTALVRVASRRSAAAQRLTADVRRHAQLIAGAYSVGIDESKSDGPDIPFASTARQIGRACGSDVVAAAAERSYGIRAHASTAWPPARLFREVDPLARLHLGGRRQESEEAATNIAVTPGSAIVSQASIERYVDQRTEALPSVWRRSIRDRARDNARILVDRVDAAIPSVDLGADRRAWWWSSLNVMQWISVCTGMVGILWLVLLWGGAAFYVNLPGPPMLGPVSVPTVLLLIGIVGGIVLSLIARSASRSAARAVAQRVEREFTVLVERLARDVLIGPLERDLADFARFRAALRVAAT